MTRWGLLCAVVEATLTSLLSLKMSSLSLYQLLRSFALDFSGYQNFAVAIAQ
jgi:hypothetical protein